MKKCLKCNLNFETDRFTCPFCKSNLKESDDKQIEIVYQSYPKFKKDEKKTSFVLKLFIFLSVLSVVICALISFLEHDSIDGFYPLLIVIASVLVCWAFIKGVILSKLNFALRIISFSICLIALLMIIEYDLSNDSWVLNYMIPFILCASLLTILMALFIKIKRFQNFISLMIGLCVLNCVPIRLYKLGFIIIKWPAIVSASTALACILGMLIFGFKETVLELKKRFHT